MKADKEKNKKKKTKKETYLWSTVENPFCIHKLAIVPPVSCVVQVTTVCTFGIRLFIKINTDAIWFAVTKQLAGFHTPYLDSCYIMIHQAFVSEEENWRERQFTTITYTNDGLYTSLIM